MMNRRSPFPGHVSPYLLHAKIAAFLILYLAVAMVVLSFASERIGSWIARLDMPLAAVISGAFLIATGVIVVRLREFRAQYFTLKRAGQGHAPEMLRAIQTAWAHGELVHGTLIATAGGLLAARGTLELLGAVEPQALFATVLGRVLLLGALVLPSIIGGWVAAHPTVEEIPGDRG